MSDTANSDNEPHTRKQTRLRTIAYKLTGRRKPGWHISAMLGLHYKATLRFVETIPVWAITPRNPNDSPTLRDLCRQLGHELEVTPMARRVLYAGVWLGDTLELDLGTVRDIGGIRHTLAYLDILAQDVLNDWAHDALQTELTNYWAKPSVRGLQDADGYPHSPQQLDWL